jgi:UPF0716 protein FxsA
MLRYLLLLFTVVPLVELALLVWIGGQTAWWFPILLVLVTGVAGAAMVRWQGWRIVERIQADLRSGRMPADAMVDGLLILVAGAMLVTPGVLTDLVGVVLLVPTSRRLVKRRVAAWLRQHIRVATMGAGAFRAEAPSGDQIIDADVIETTVDDAR